MKKNSIIILLIAIVAFDLSCTQNKKHEKIKSLVNGAIQVDPEKLQGSEPIPQIAAELEKTANKTLTINQSNMEDALQEAQNYSKTFITVGSYTLVKITSFDDCQKSTTWGTCMPKGTALIQRSGNFKKVKDYLNHIIGKPDDQIRKMYLFK
ncbi:MAG TPA: hypothetical protein PKH79_02370 [Prolixibacteraceae bacterium]|nr:hypothetical protein [Prolixibacteraceae bacterium]